MWDYLRGVSWNLHFFSALSSSFNDPVGRVSSTFIISVLLIEPDMPLSDTHTHTQSDTNSSQALTLTPHPPPPPPLHARKNDDRAEER